MLSKLHSLNLKLCSKQYNKNFVLHLIVAPQLGGGRQHNYSTKTKLAGYANEQSMYSLMSMGATYFLCHYVERSTSLFVPPLTYPIVFCHHLCH
jgi:hypothetical protein